MAQARKITAEQEVPNLASCPAVPFAEATCRLSHQAPSELEERILNALVILALKLQRNVLEVIPIYERLEKELEVERNRRDVLQRSAALLAQRRPSQIKQTKRPS